MSSDLLCVRTLECCSPSKTEAWMPCRCRIRASVRPPGPAPTMPILGLGGKVTLIRISDDKISEHAMLLRLLLILTFLASTALAQTYDIVLANGRVIDPETNLDAVRNVGILGGRIASVSSSALQGRTVLEARGLIVTA